MVKVGGSQASDSVINLVECTTFDQMNVTNTNHFGGQNYKIHNSDIVGGCSLCDPKLREYIKTKLEEIKNKYNKQKGGACGETIPNIASNFSLSTVSVPLQSAQVSSQAPISGIPQDVLNTMSATASGLGPMSPYFVLGQNTDNYFSPPLSMTGGRCMSCSQQFI